MERIIPKKAVKAAARVTLALSLATGVGAALEACGPGPKVPIIIAPAPGPHIPNEGPRQLRRDTCEVVGKVACNIFNLVGDIPEGLNKGFVCVYGDGADTIITGIENGARAASKPGQEADRCASGNPKVPNVTGVDLKWGEVKADFVRTGSEISFPPDCQFGVNKCGLDITAGPNGIWDTTVGPSIYVDETTGNGPFFGTIKGVPAICDVNTIRDEYFCLPDVKRRNHTTADYKRLGEQVLNNLAAEANAPRINIRYNPVVSQQLVKTN
ncbi:MAG TPA: hypothetical protein VF810_04140 [Patescibacteria group bacterium]